VAGASLPLRLPGQANDPSVNLVPIISSGRAAELVLRAWDKRFGRTADGIILEGPLAGGHLGFSLEQLERIEDYSLPGLLAEVLEAVKAYEDKYGKKIPVIAGGGIFTGKDIAKMLLAGASGVQMATRFVGTIECDVAPEFKQAYLSATKEDIVIIKSPVGLPGRAIRNNFIKEVEKRGKLDIRCPYRCLSTCDVLNAKYCIAQLWLMLVTAMSIMALFSAERMPTGSTRLSRSRNSWRNSWPRSRPIDRGLTSYRCGISRFFMNTNQVR